MTGLTIDGEEGLIGRREYNLLSFGSSWHIKPFFKVNPAPYVMAPKAEDELDPLNKAEVIKPVALLEWVAPIVPVLKRSYHQ